MPDEITPELIEWLRQHGLVVVPIEPTEEMVKAAWASAISEDAAEVWRDMVGQFTFPDPGCPTP